MAKLRRVLSRSFLLILVLIAAAVAAAPLVPLSPLRSKLEHDLAGSLGRKVAIQAVKLSFINGPRLTIAGMTAQEDPEFGDGFFIQAEEVLADIDFVQYLRSGRLAVSSITLRSPSIQLVRRGDGSWSWTTLGRKQSESPPVSPALFAPVNYFDPLSAAGQGFASAIAGNVSAAELKTIRIENAIVTLKSSDATDQVYRKVELNASMKPAPDPQRATEATGELKADSPQEGVADLFKAALPFDIKIEHPDASVISASGSIGPGPLETRNLSAGAFAINGQITGQTGTPLSGKGHLSASDLLIRPINLSERVAAALRVSDIGDMNPGTSIGAFDSEFQVSQGTVLTRGLSIKQLDGLGDATAQTGSFKVNSGLIVSYAATLNLSTDATSRLKSASPILGILGTILETNNRLSVPININGNLERPQVYIDINRIF